MKTNYDLSIQNGMEWNIFIIEIPGFIKDTDIIDVSTEIANVFLKYQNKGFVVTKDKSVFSNQFNYGFNGKNWWAEVPIERWAEKKEIWTYHSFLAINTISSVLDLPTHKIQEVLKK